MLLARWQYAHGAVVVHFNCNLGNVQCFSFFSGAVTDGSKDSHDNKYKLDLLYSGVSLGVRNNIYLYRNNYIHVCSFPSIQFKIMKC